MLMSCRLQLVAWIANGELYCPDQNSFQFSDSATWQGDIHGAGWSVRGQGGVHGLTSFNLLGGFVEFDMDTTQATSGMNTNFYTISPDHPYTSYQDYCDGQGPYASSPSGTYCLEMDIIEANGHCAAAATWHTEYNMNGGCDRAGCAVVVMPEADQRYDESAMQAVDLRRRVHVKAEFSPDGWMTTYYNGRKLSKFNRQPSDDARRSVYDTMSTVGAAVQSTQWHGWAPGNCDDYGENPNSVFSISNLKFSGSVVQGPVPPTCRASPEAKAALDACMDSCPTQEDAFAECAKMCSNQYESAVADSNELGAVPLFKLTRTCWVFASVAMLVMVAIGSYFVHRSKQSDISSEDYVAIC